MKKLPLCLWAAFSASVVQAAEPVSLEKVLLRARDQNLEISAAREAWKVKRAAVRPIGVWENPRFSYIDERDPSGVDGVDPMKKQRFRVEQRVPFPGKLTSEVRMKRHEALIAEADYRARILTVLKETRMRYYQLYLNDQQIDLANQSMILLKGSLRAAQSRLASGQSSALDVFMIQTELARAENSQLRLQTQRKLTLGELNALLNQDPGAAFGPVAPPNLFDLPLPLKDFQTLAREQDPLYMSSLHEINHARAMLTSSRLAFAPDFDLMAERQTAQEGPAGRMLGVSVSFPLWLHRPWGNLQASKDHVTEAEAKSKAMQNTVARNVAAEFMEAQTRLTLTRRYITDILPSARSALKIAQDRYASGSDDFMRLLEAYRTWITANNEYQNELYSYGEHASTLEQWVGVDLVRAREAMNQREWDPTEVKHD